LKVSLFLICLAAMLWGTSGTTMVFITNIAPMNPLLVAFWRLAIASPFLLLYAATKNFLITNSSHTSLEGAKPYALTAFTSSWKTYLGLGVCMAAYQACYFWAVPLAGVAVTALVSICSSPIFIALFAAKFLREKLTKKIYIALGLGLFGTSLLVINPQATIAQDWRFFGGVLFALGAGLTYAAYAVGSKAIIKKLPPFTVLAYSFSIAALLLSPALLFASHQIINTLNNQTINNSLTNTQNWQLQLPFLLYLGIVSTGFAYLIYIQGLKSTQATVAGIAVLLEPLTATCLGIVIFKETLGISGVIGGVLLVGSIALLSFPEPDKASKG
jgi:DME family drug/metabolite transporter